MADVVSEIKRLKPTDIAMAIGFFLAVLGPGFLTLYLFIPRALEHYDTLKVIFFSSALSLPVFAFNIAATSITADKTIHDDQLPYWMLSSIMTMGVFYPSLLLSYTQSYKFTTFLAVLAVIQLLTLLIALPVIAREEKKERERKADKTDAAKT